MNEILSIEEWIPELTGCSVDFGKRRFRTYSKELLGNIEREQAERHKSNVENYMNRKSRSQYKSHDMLGACNSRTCGVGCGWFFPDAGGTGALATTKCAVCGCAGFGNAQKEADLNPLAATSKKRKRKGRSPKPKSKPEKETKYCAVFAPYTKAVAKDHCDRPDSQGLLDLDSSGYVQTIRLPDEGSESLIRQRMSDAFGHLAEFDRYGWRICRVKRPKHRSRGGKLTPKAGSARQIRPHYKGKIKFTAWTTVLILFLRSALADTTVRRAGFRFRRTIFIALNPTAPNLPVPGEPTEADGLDHDLDSVHSMSDDADEEDDDSDPDADLPSSNEEQDFDERSPTLSEEEFPPHLKMPKMSNTKGKGKRSIQ
ncbi:hypothetical protein B0H14DRAFT_2567816 [Mycena olivaceomarginata]|nr:hypothetical protein B0H14DRAFT_2567816 [Mycena olivaceomarginata]